MSNDDTSLVRCTLATETRLELVESWMKALNATVGEQITEAVGRAMETMPRAGDPNQANSLHNMALTLENYNLRISNLATDVKTLMDRQTDKLDVNGRQYVEKEYLDAEALKILGAIARVRDLIPELTGSIVDEVKRVAAVLQARINLCPTLEGMVWADQNVKDELKQLREEMRVELRKAAQATDSIRTELLACEMVWEKGFPQGDVKTEPAVNVPKAKPFHAVTNPIHPSERVVGWVLVKRVDNSIEWNSFRKSPRLVKELSIFDPYEYTIQPLRWHPAGLVDQPDANR